MIRRKATVAVAVVALMLPLLPSADATSVTLYMSDSQGNGWNGTYFSLYSADDDTSALETVTLDSGNSGTHDFDVDLSSCYVFERSSQGSYDDGEISYMICDSGEMAANESTTFCIDTSGDCTVESTAIISPNTGEIDRSRLKKAQTFIGCYFGLTIGLSWVFQTLFYRFSSRKTATEVVPNDAISTELPTSSPGAATEVKKKRKKRCCCCCCCAAASCCARLLKPIIFTKEDYEIRRKLVKGVLYWDKGFWGDFFHYQANNHPFISLVFCSRLHPFSGNDRRLSFLITQAFCVFFTVVFSPLSDDAVLSIVLQLFVVSPITLIVGKITVLVYQCGCLNKSRASTCAEMLKKVAGSVGWLIGAVFVIIGIVLLIVAAQMMGSKSYDITPDELIRDFLLSQASQIVQSPWNDLLRLFWSPVILLKLKCIPLFKGGQWRKERREFLAKEGKGFVDDKHTRRFLCLGTNDDVITYARNNKGLGSSSSEEDRENHVAAANNEEVMAVTDVEDGNNDEAAARR